MTGKRDEALRQLERLVDALASDVDELTEGELLQEVTEDHGDPAKLAEDVQALIEGTISAHGRTRLAIARQGLEARRSEGSVNVISLSLDRKRALVEKFANDNSELREKLTMAARNEKDSEADIDSFLGDLVALGAIDDKGNIL